MKKLLLSISVVFAVVFSAFLPASQIEIAEIYIAHFNDLHGRIWSDQNGYGGLVKLTAAWKRFHALHRNNSILVSSGDLITGSALSSLTKGEGVYRLANIVGIDVFTPGNHEFDYGVGQYLQFMRIARFPFIVANIKPEPRSQLAEFADAPYSVMVVGGVRVGIIGATTDKTPQKTFKRNTAGAVFESPVGAINSLAQKLSGRTDIVVALTHVGFDGGESLADRLKGVDLVIDGHTHRVTAAYNATRKTFFAQAGSDGKYLGVAKINFDLSTKEITKIRENFIPIGPQTPQNSELAAAARAEESALPVRLDEEIAVSTKAMSQTRIATWLAGLMKNYAGADLGLMNVGGVRSSILPGAITYREIYDISPFDNQIVIVSLRGEDLKKWLDAKYEKLKTDRKFKPEPNRIYRVATLDFIADVFGIPEDQMRVMPKDIRELMIEDLKARKVIR